MKNVHALIATAGCALFLGVFADAPAFNALTVSCNPRTDSYLTGSLTVVLSDGAGVDVVVATDQAFSNVHARFSDNLPAAGSREFPLSGLTPGVTFHVRAIATLDGVATTNTTTFTTSPGFDDMCYKPPEKQADYPWTWSQYWFSDPNSGTGLGYMPSLGDDVLLYSSKNVNVPLRIATGVHATTRALRFGNTSRGGNNPQRFQVDAGATITNAGQVIVGGNSATSDTAGHLFVSGEWTALTNFYLGRSNRTSTMTVNEGGRFVNDNLIPPDGNSDSGNEFIVGNCGVAVDNIVTNRGEMNLFDLHAGSNDNRARGIIENYGTMNIKRKLTLGRHGYGYFHHHKGATLNKGNMHNKPVIIAHNGSSDATLELDDDVTFPGSLQMSNNGTAKSRLILNDATLVVSNIVEICRGNGATAAVVLNGDSSFKFTRNRDGTLLIGCASNTTSRITLKGQSRLDGVYCLRIPYAEAATGVVEFLDSSCLTNCSGRAIVMAEQRLTNGRLIIGDNAFVGPLTNLSMCIAREVPRAVLEMRGGTIGFVGSTTDWSLFLGNAAAPQVTSRVMGWGRIKRTGNSSQMIRMTTYGQVIADGEGTPRDLHFGNVRTVGYSTGESNTTGSNGWFAVNQGRLVYPRIQEINGSSHRVIGDYPNRATPLLVNSLRFTMDTYPSVANYHAYAELYAADRIDIPTGLPLRRKNLVKGVWRLGFSSGDGLAEVPVPVSFAGLTLQIRHDVQDVPADYKMDVWHHDGSSTGSWRRVMKSVLVNRENPLLQTTEKIQPSSEVWNAGWFAVVARPVSEGVTIILR